MFTWFSYGFCRKLVPEGWDSFLALGFFYIGNRALKLVHRFLFRAPLHITLNTTKMLCFKLFPFNCCFLSYSCTLSVKLTKLFACPAFPGQSFTRPLSHLETREYLDIILKTTQAVLSQRKHFGSLLSSLLAVSKISSPHTSCVQRDVSVSA